jgi:predicted nucleic acid-binding protein
MDHILLDTDLILDFFLGRKPFSESAAQVLNLCRLNKITGYITPVIIANTYYLLRKNAPHATVIEKLKHFLTIIEVIEMNKQNVIDALNSPFKDFEDALQNYSAVSHSKVSVILTRNIKDFKNSSLPVLTPDTYLKARSLETDRFN